MKTLGTLSLIAIGLGCIGLVSTYYFFWVMGGSLLVLSKL